MQAPLFRTYSDTADRIGFSNIPVHRVRTKANRRREVREGNRNGRGNGYVYGYGYGHRGDRKVRTATGYPRVHAKSVSNAAHSVAPYDPFPVLSSASSASLDGKRARALEYERFRRALKEKRLLHRYRDLAIRW